MSPFEHSVSTPGSRYTLHAISNPAIFQNLYPAIAAAGRAFLRGRPGIAEYRLRCAHVSADGSNKSMQPVLARIHLESATRSLVIRLEPNQRGEWIPSVESDRELQRWERRSG